MALVDTPFENPTAYNSITIEGVDTPGLCTFKGGGDRKLKIEGQQAPGFTGAFTVCRGEELPTIDYEIHVWTKEDYRALQELAAKLRAAQKKRPPKILELVDLAVAHNEIARVVVASVGAFTSPKTGKWFLPVSFAAWQKRKPIGGVPKPPLTEAQMEIERLGQENPRLEQQLRAAEIAAQREGGGGGLLGFLGN
jgi:hypothetical protein